MRKTTQIFAMIMVGMMVFVSSCKKDFLDVNTNPNSPSDVDMEFLLPSAQANIAYTMGDQLQIVGGIWGQFWTQGPNGSQYKDLDRYIYTSTEANRPWLQMYSGALADLNAIEKKAKESGSAEYEAIALTLKAYCFQVLVDGWGKVPFSEALDAENFPTPNFDSEEAVYDGIAEMLDSAVSKMDPNSSFHTNGDLFYGGDQYMWWKFANTLRLKLYLRQSEVRPATAQAGINQLSLESAEFLDAGEDAMQRFTNGLGARNPLYSTISALYAYNIMASNTYINYVFNTGDYRAYDLFTIAFTGAAAGDVNGIDQGDGTNLPAPQTNTNYSIPHPNVGGPDYEDPIWGDILISGETAPVKIMTASESKFLQAEAVARGWMAGDAQALYEEGIRISWDALPFAASYDASSAEYTAFMGAVAYPNGSTAANLEAIITQKWASMCGTQNFEAWCEWRRTGYPSFFTESLSSFLSPGSFPARFLYSDDEYGSNPNIPGGVQITDHVWWDTN